jgi:hypothetical protein
VTVIDLPLVTGSSEALVVALAARLSWAIVDRVSRSPVLRPPSAFHSFSETPTFQVVASLLESTCSWLGCGSMQRLPSQRACLESIS